MTPSQVRDIQRSVNAYHGREVLEVDGSYGAKTRAEVVAIQREHKIEPDGIVGPDTRRAFQRGRPAPAATPSAPTSPGVSARQPIAVGRENSPEQVRELQRSLNTYFGREVVEPDGNYGPQTRERVVQVQTEHGLEPDGIAGRQTRDAIARGRPEGAPPVTSPLPVERSPEAQQIADRLRAQGFSITNLPSGGIQARGTIPGYPERVSMFIPADYQPREQVPIAMHMHGFTLGRSVDREVYGRFDFDQMARDGRFRGITVVPESRDRVATYNSHLATGPQFDRFMGGVTRAIGNAGAIQNFDVDNPQRGVSRILLSGHSGAYLPIAQLAGRQGAFLDRVQGIGLFDATYSAGNVHRHVRQGRDVIARGGLFYVSHIQGSRTAAAAASVRQGFGSEAWHRVTGPGPLASPARGAVFVEERPGGNAQHWAVFGRRYAEFLRSFAE